MKPIVRLIGLVTLSLSLTGLALFAGGDRRTLTAPPESVAEGFVRQLVTRRFRQAQPYLARELGARADARRLRELGDGLRALGDVQDVRGELRASDGDRARAAARLTLRGGRSTSFEFPMRLESGTWAIDSLASLEQIATVP